MFGSSIFDGMIQKLSLWIELSEEDRVAIRALPHTIRMLAPGDFIVREDEEPTHCCLLLEGNAIRHKASGSGGRQIFSIQIQGDVVDLHNSLLHRADHNIQTLAAAKVALLPVDALRDIVAKYPMVGQAMWYETLVDASISREWSLNIGRRDARVRIAHLLCELAVRLLVAGQGNGTEFYLPLTQEQFGDALALSPVHVNRTLMALAEDDLIERRFRSIRILDHARLARVGDFDVRYLHLDRALQTANNISSSLWFPSRKS
jgi:CRP-like cAMP-binding protein